MPSYLSLPGTSGNYASTPDSAALSIAGDLDLRIKAAMDDWTPAVGSVLFSKYTAASRDYLFQVNSSSGTVRFTRGDGAATSVLSSSSASPTVADGASLWLRWTHRLSDQRVQFFTSVNGVDWSQLGTDRFITPITPGDGTQGVEIGSNSGGTAGLWAGKVYTVEIRDGIDGTVVASPDFTALSPGETSFQDAQGNTWTINGTAAIVAQSLGGSDHVHRKLRLLTG